MEMVHERAVIAVPLSWTPSSSSMRAVGALVRRRTGAYSVEAVARREEEIFARVDSYNEGPLYNENLREIYATILKIMKETPSV